MPRDAGTLLDRAYCHIALNQYSLAIPDLDEALSINPKSDNGYLNRGAAYFGLGQHQRALEDFDRALALNPNLTNAHTGRQQALQALGRKTDEAPPATAGEGPRITEI